jgi:hypothetical protein
MRTSTSVRSSFLLVSAGLAAAAAVFGAPAVARAADHTQSNGTLPGFVCRKIGSSGVLAYTSDGAIYNNVAAGNPALTVECPIASAAQGIKTWGGTTVTYLDQSPSSVTCTIRTEDNDSTSFQSWTQWSTTDDNSYGTMSFAGIQGYADGHMHFRCTIPARDNEGNPSYIIGYEVLDDPGPDASVPTDVGYHTFTGNMCRHVSGVPGFTSDGAISNIGTSTLTLDCPVMATRNAGVSQAKTKIWYVDSSPNTLSCTMAAEAADSTAVSQISQNSTFDDNGYHAFTFSGSKAITTFNGGYVHARCSVPPPDSGGAASFIVGYGFSFDQI